MVSIKKKIDFPILFSYIINVQNMLRNYLISLNTFYNITPSLLLKSNKTN